jgi:hypothetical protein
MRDTRGARQRVLVEHRRKIVELARRAATVDHTIMVGSDPR